MILKFEIQGIPKKQEKHWKGILLSFFTTIEEVLSKRRKASYLTHFFQERLDKGERREFLRILAKLNLQLVKETQEIQTNVLASTENSKIPIRYQKIFNTFKDGVSESATTPRQSPKQGKLHKKKGMKYTTISED